MQSMQIIASLTRTTRVVAMLAVAAFALGAGLEFALAQRAPAQEWSRYRDPVLGLSVDLPISLLAPMANRQGDESAMFATADDRARLNLFTFESRGETPARHLRRIKNEGPARFTYERTSRRFFVASGFYEGKIFYRRCNFPSVTSRVRCVELRYPAAEKRAWDGIVTRISNSLRAEGAG